jgi:hypothetical protein
MVEIPIRTHKPDKWRFVDLETGDIWKWDEKEYPGNDLTAGYPMRTGHFSRAKDIKVEKIEE